MRSRRKSAAARREREEAARPLPPDWPRMVERVLYRDGLMLVLDKPAGLPVHPGPGGGITVEDYLDALRFGLRTRPHLAHRLDRDTSGCLVLGRHRKALRRLGALFRQGRVGKTYWAIVHGRPPQDAGVIDLPLSKVSRDSRSWWMRPDPAGQPAVTEYRVLASDGEVSWVELRPRTGRTHQLRVHMAALGCPIVGDPVYGRPEDRGTPMMLHARAVEIPLYPNRPPVRVEAPVPDHMRPLVERLRAAAAAPGRGLPPADGNVDPAREPGQDVAHPRGREDA